ncbi:MAG: NIPSNAP family protein [Pirellulaceae bacterium]
MGRYLNWSAGIVIMTAVIGAFWAGQTAGEDAVQGNTAKGERVYELRTYYCLPGRLEALHKRFADHTLKLFEKHGMKNEMYWTPTDPKLKDHVLIYVVSHDSVEAAKKSWDGFRADPDWIKARDASEKDGKIVEKVESVYMTATAFSPKK